MSANIALIILDSLRHDSFDRLFDWVSGKRFHKAYATSHWTIPSHASMFTGQYPSEVGVHGKSPSLDCPDAVLAEKLSNEGYCTRFYSANTTVTHWDGWDRGFDELITLAQLDPRDSELIDWSRFARENPNGNVSRKVKAVIKCIKSDVPTLTGFRQGIRYFRRSRADGGAKKIIERVDKTKYNHEKEFLVINLMETHTPYYSPDGGNPINVTIGDAFAGQVKNPERIQAGYRKSVEVLAKEYKKLYTILKDDFDYVITVGDHGEMLGEDKMWNHGYGLYPELVRIPLVISGNDIPDSEHNGLVSILDIHKTIGDLAGVELNSRGNNLIDSPSERPLITEYHGFLPWHRDQFERKGVPDRVYDEHDTELYGIVSRHGYAYDTHSDGFCTDDYIDLTEAKKQVREIRNGINEREVETFDTQIDESTKQQLRELGYA